MEMEQWSSWVSDAFLTSVVTDDYSFPDCDTFFSTAGTPSNSESGSSSRTQKAPVAPGPTGKIKKKRKKKKKSERPPTTFIATEASNFRQMVERMTGGGGGTPAVAPFRPEQQEPPAQSWFSPGLDDSALPPQAFSVPGLGGGFGSFGPTAAAAGRARFDFGQLPCFPILESGGAA